MKQKKKNNEEGGLVYSTNPFFQLGNVPDERETPSASAQDLRVWIDRKHRGGKTVTIIREFVGREEDLADLGKKLKSLCGTGGTVKEGEILIQGDHREKIMNFLAKEGFRAKKAGA
ncbi:MAG: translation initiation factor [Bacteroidetes bacterium]|nr:translation initiation factor [Bacteroidota bacterium]MBU1717448.1 translation initiation factor [Bacteroidota bacterium]